MPDGSCVVDFHSYPGTELDILCVERNALSVKSVKLPCGKCPACKLEKSRQWAVRIMHESKFHKQNCFITLTYAPAYLPSDGKLVKSDVQKFIKRLRKRHPGSVIRYYFVGEYGRKHHRPHYHAIIFGYDFPDKKLLFISNGLPVYESAELQSLWPFGISSVGTLTFESAAYVARYILKNDGTADKGFSLMSLKPGIGSMFFDVYSGDIYNTDKVSFRRHGKIVTCRPPRFYDKLLERTNPNLYLSIKEKRLNNLVDYNSDELLAKNKIQVKKMELLLRKLEDNL